MAFDELVSHVTAAVVTGVAQSSQTPVLYSGGNTPQQMRAPQSIILHKDSLVELEKKSH